MLNIFRDWKKKQRRKFYLKKFKENLSFSLAEQYSEKEYYDVEELIEAYADLGLPLDYFLDYICLFTRKKDFDRLMETYQIGLDYNTHCETLQKLGTGSGVPPHDKSIVVHCAYNLITRTYGGQHNH